MLERWEVLRQTPWPHLDAFGLVMLARWVAGLLLAFGAAHLLARWLRGKFLRPIAPPETQMERSERAA